MNEMQKVIKFDQDLINWMNRYYPEKNCVLAGGPQVQSTRTFPRLDWTPMTSHNEHETLSVKVRELADFETLFDANIFWDGFAPGQLEATIGHLCEYLIRFSHGDTFYMHSLEAFLMKSRQPLVSDVTVCVKWKLKYCTDRDERV